MSVYRMTVYSMSVYRMTVRVYSMSVYRMTVRVYSMSVYRMTVYSMSVYRMTQFPFLELVSEGICKNADVISIIVITPCNCCSISSIGRALAQSGNITLFTLLASIQMRRSLFSRYSIVNGFMNDQSDNSNIPSSIICSIRFLTPAVAEYGTGLEGLIVGVVSVILNVYSYTLHISGLMVKNSMSLSSISISFPFVAFLRCYYS
jgi:hypothetical protein